jgi:hypothetical protein
MGHLNEHPMELLSQEQAHWFQLNSRSLWHHRMLYIVFRFMATELSKFKFKNGIIRRAAKIRFYFDLQRKEKNLLNGQRSCVLLLITAPAFNCWILLWFIGLYRVGSGLCNRSLWRRSTVGVNLSSKVIFSRSDNAGSSRGILLLKVNNAKRITSKLSLKSVPVVLLPKRITWKFRNHILCGRKLQKE